LRPAASLAARSRSVPVRNPRRPLLPLPRTLLPRSASPLLLLAARAPRVPLAPVRREPLLAVASGSPPRRELLCSAIARTLRLRELLCSC